MSRTSQSDFERCVLASGLLTQQQVEEALAALRWTKPDAAGPAGPPSDRQLADKLVELDLLNRWQAEQLLQGRTKFNLGPYWMIDAIGQGGMGQVFKAEHGVMGRVVAVKVLPRSRCTPEAIANFTREIRLLAKLDDPNLVRALDAGHDGNVYYLVTEYVPGTDLRRLVRANGPLSMEAAATVASQVARGLQHAHDQGLIHRDVKPANILVTPDGHAKLLDLGLSGPVEGTEDTRFGKIVGTADYLAPDHVQVPWDPKPAWDIYSLGCTLYFAATGRVPFPGGTVKDKARAQCELVPLDPRNIVPSLSGDFVDVIAEMMAKDPARRIASAKAVVERLRPWVDESFRKAGRRAGRGSRRPPGDWRTGPTAVEKGGFPEMPAPGDSSGSQSTSQVWPTGSNSVAVSGDDTLPAMDGQNSTERTSMVRLLLFMLALPLALVTVVMAVYWVVTVVKG